MPQEIELKLTLDPGDVSRLRKTATLQCAGADKATRQRIISTYYDTPSLSLLHHDIALRLRKTGRTRVQSIKLDGSNNQYPARRAEFESPIPGDRPDLQRVEDSAIRHLIERSCAGDKLKPVFSTNIMREIRPIESGRNRIECAIDRGFVVARGKKKEICEVELELKSGEPSSLLHLARRLNVNIPLRIEPASKAARGYALINGAERVVPKAQPVDLDAAMTARDSIIVVMRACIAHVIASADCTLNDDDPEALHQLRVAIRRTRVVFSIIRRHVGKDLDLRIAADLRSLQQKLGGAREWDVLVGETLKQAPKRLVGPRISAHLQQIVKAARAAGYRQARAALRDHGCTDLLLRLAFWLDIELGSGDGHKKLADATVDALAISAKGFAAQVIRDCHRKVRKASKKIQELDSAGLHRLRIRIKKLRYATEFFGSLWPRRSSRKYLSALKNLQQALGAFHDTTIATTLIGGLKPVGATDIERGIERIDAWLLREQQHQRKQVIALWSKFKKQESFC